MPIYPFERTVYPIRYPSPFLVKGNNSKVKGPGGIIPSSSSGDGVGEHDAVQKKNASGVGKTEGSGANKGQQHAGNATTQGSGVATASSVVPTPQPQYQQLMQQTQHPQHQLVQRPPGPDRSVFTAAGGTALGNNIQIEKLPPEISELVSKKSNVKKSKLF
jgi:chromatin structure-remodeling complex subunit RSC1/2